MDTITKGIAKLSDWAWGPPMLILLVGIGLYLTIKLRGLQFRHLPHALRLIFRREEGKGDISHFGALMTALAATVGNGNIVGVASAITLGGPGAVFWMWVTGLIGMATKYSEALLAVKYRQEGKYGMRGGPMYYLTEGAGLKWLGILFALFAAIAAFGIGNMVQAKAVAEQFNHTFGIKPLFTAIGLMILTGMVILGGIKSISRFASVLVPFMIIGYFGAGLIILVLNMERIPEAFGLIFKYAFTPWAPAGGFFGSVIAQTMRNGVARGVFSNESGLGSSPIAAAAAKTKDPPTQALVSMTQTFIDTIVVCTMTALIILTATAWTEGVGTERLTHASFQQTLGKGGGIVVALASGIFAYSSILGWCYYGEKSIEFLGGPKTIVPYRVAFVAAIMCGILFHIDFILKLSDVMNALMAVPNLIGLLLLAGVVKRETDAYFAKRRAGTNLF